MAKDKLKIPTSAAGRLTKIAAASAKVIAREVVKKIDQKTQASQSIRQAKEVVEALSQLKGAAMKTGQILSLELSDILPPEITEILSKLHDDSSFLPEEKVRKILAKRLGKQRFELIEGLSSEPIAAASIGQVHSGSINGEKVAIKFQYPGVDKSISADLKVLEKLLKPVLWARGQKINLEPIFSELESVLKNEVDYNKEAKFLEKYHNFTQDSSQFIVPRVFKDFSTKTVLTMSFEDGLSIKDWVASKPSIIEKDKFSDLILRLILNEFLVWGFVQTDPNFGNFLYRPSTNQLVLLDFGACKTYSKNLRKTIISLVDHTLAGNDNEIIESAIKNELIDDRESLETKKLFVNLMKLICYIFEDKNQPFDFGDLEYLNKLRATGLEFANSVIYSGPASELIFLNRKLGGMFHLLKDLAVQKDLSKYWVAAKDQLYNN